MLVWSGQHSWVAVRFWYSWLFNHVSGSSLLTLIAHPAEDTIETGTVWQAGGGTTRMAWLCSLVWCAVAIALLTVNRRFCTRSPAQVDGRDRSNARVAAP
jgi:hypothetical protein